MFFASRHHCTLQLQLSAKGQKAQEREKKSIWERLPKPYSTENHSQAIPNHVMILFLFYFRENQAYTIQVCKKQKIGNYPVLCGSKLNKKHMVLMKYSKDSCDRIEDGAVKNSDPTLSALISTLSHQHCIPPYTPFTCICVKGWMFRFNFKALSLKAGLGDRIVDLQKEKREQPNRQPT